MKKGMLGMVLMVVVLFLVGSAGAASYSYFPGQLSIADDWAFQSSGNYVSTIFSYSTVNNLIDIHNKYGGAVYDHRLAYTWTAPEGEVITQVNCTWSRYGYRSDWNIAWYSSTDAGASIDAMTADWTSNANASTSRTQTYNVEDEIAKIGLGSLSAASDLNHEVKFNYISITTAPIPEPGTLTLLGVASLALLRRKK